ncbi:MAG TPA: ABC transporter permease [Acidimicrobiales bacterium]|nr:ABC transporter permease [Acidimicrobiales bacterium]
MLRAALLVARNDLRRRIRNRSLIIQAVIGPVLLASVISAAFSGGFGFDVEIGIVDQDRSELSRAVERGLLAGEADEVTFRSVDDPGAASRLVDDSDIGAAIVLPAGFADSLVTDDPTPVGLVVHEQNPVPAAVAKAVADGLSARVNAGRLTALSLVAVGEPVPSPDELTGIELPVTVERLNSEDLSPAALVAPGMGLLFLFFTVGAVARSLLEERRDKVLDRIRAAPVSLASVLLGKALAVVVLGLTSVLTLWGITSVVFGADWGDPSGVLPVLVAATLAIGGISAFVASLARDPQTADLAATGVAFILGILGGSLVPLSELPDGLRRLSMLTPNGWAQQAFAELSAGGASLADVVPEAGVLLVWAAVSVLLASLLLPRRLVTR